MEPSNGSPKESMSAIAGDKTWYIAFPISRYGISFVFVRDHNSFLGKVPLTFTDQGDLKDTDI